MKKRNKGFTVKHQGSLVIALVIASIIGGVMFFAAPVDASENTQHTQQEAIQNEDTEGKIMAVESTGGDTGSSSSGQGDVTVDWCYVTLASGDDIPAINRWNSYKVDTALCRTIVLLIYDYYQPTAQ